MPTVQVNDVTLHYESVGDGSETLLFSHGYLMNKTMFNGQIDALQKQFRCIAYDHRGHGESEVTKDGYALDNLVTDAIKFIEELAIGPVHFVGMSTGGFVGMRIALRRPDLLKSLVLMDTSAEEESAKTLKKNNLLLWVVKNIGWFPVTGQVMSIIFHDTFLKDTTRKQEVKKWRNIITGQDKKGLVPFGKGIFARGSVLEKLSNLQIPTAVIIGEFDVATPPIHSKRLVETIPNANLYTIADAGHSAAIEKPIEVTQALKDFYKKVGIV
ncbi:MAG: alpha/beta fold hydrolase [Thermonemataceae bacterium]